MVLAEVAIDLTESGWSNSEYRPPLPHGDGARKAWLFQEEEEVNLIKSVSILVVMIVDADTATARGGGDQHCTARLPRRNGWRCYMDSLESEKGEKMVKRTRKETKWSRFSSF